MTMSFLLRLSKYSLLALLKNWICIHEIGSLDSAVCCKVDRPFFLEVISQHPAVFKGYGSALTTAFKSSLAKNYYNWLIVRDVSLEDVLILDNESLESALRCLESNSKLGSIKIIIIIPIALLSYNQSLNFELFNNILENVKNLEEFYCHQTITKDVVHSLVLNCRRLSVFHTMAFRLGNECLKVLLETCQNLTNVSLSREDVTSDFFFLSSLECFSLIDSRLTDYMAAKIGHLGNSLKHLCLQNVNGVSEDGIIFVMQRMSRILTLKLINCNSVTDEVLVTISSSCPFLSHVSFSYCARVSNEGVKILCERCIQITDLDISETHKTTMDLADVIVKTPLLLSRVKFGNSKNTIWNFTMLWIFSYYFASVTELNLDNPVIVGTPRKAKFVVTAISSHAALSRCFAFERTRIWTDIRLALDNFSGSFAMLTSFQATFHPKLFTCATTDYISLAQVALILSSTRRLTSLSLSMLNETVDQGLSTCLLDSCHSLTQLSLTNFLIGEVHTTTWDICNILMNNRDLVTISFSCIYNLPDMVLWGMAKYCDKLRSLDLSGCCEISDHGVSSLTNGSCRLTYIDITLTNITEKGIDILKRKCLALASIKYCETSRL